MRRIHSNESFPFTSIQQLKDFDGRPVPIWTSDQGDTALQTGVEVRSSCGTRESAADPSLR